MRIKFCTITGADDSIEPEQIIELSHKYPFVEWGILLSKKSVGRNRFPSAKWMEKLNSLITDDLNFSGHLCGSWVRDLLNNGDIEFVEQVPIWDKLRRVQLNFHAEPFEMSMECLNRLRNFTWKERKEIIVQMDGVNNEIYKKLIFAGVLSAGLYDVSHGTGVLPEEWPEVIPSVNPRAFRGYAGGLGHENLAIELEKIQKAVGEDIIWVDMETKVRSDDDKLFDLSKVESCLELVKKYT